MRLKSYVARWVIDIRLLLQYRQYSHRRMLSLLSALFMVWILYRVVGALFHIGSLGLRGNPTVDHWCEREVLPSYLLRADPEEITIVTAFFNLGSYRNGPKPWQYSTPYLQKQWMRPLGRLANPMVVYVEDEDTARYFEEIRSCFPPNRTRIIRVRRQELWSFRLEPQFERIYAKSGYPQHYPNTVYPAHTSACHAKYELLERATQKDYFRTPFFAWMDAGYFRHLDQTTFDIFKLVPPRTFNSDMVSMGQAYPHDPNIPAKLVIHHNLVWVSGQMLLGVQETVLGFTEVYRHTVEQLLKHNISSSDEQTIFLMYSTPLRKAKQVMIKTYMCHEGQLGLYGRDTRFLCLGYVCRNSWDNIHKPGIN